MTDNPIQQARKDINRRIGQFICRERQKEGISQMDLSIRLGRGAKYIWRVENGYTELDVFEFVDIMEALGIDAAEALKELTG
jgi:ribosome-binding protein aMBF1 (putative translation factor)